MDGVTCRRCCNCVYCKDHDIAGDTRDTLNTHGLLAPAVLGTPYLRPPQCPTNIYADRLRCRCPKRQQVSTRSRLHAPPGTAGPFRHGAHGPVTPLAEPFGQKPAVSRAGNPYRGLTPLPVKADNRFTRRSRAEVAELADALDSGSSAPWGVRVQIPPSAPLSSPRTTTLSLASRITLRRPNFLLKKDERQNCSEHDNIVGFRQSCRPWVLTNFNNIQQRGVMGTWH